MAKPKLLLDEKTGKLVEAVREDQLLIGLQPLEEEIDDETGEVKEIEYRRVMRSKLKL